MDSSIASMSLQLAQEKASVILTSFGRTMKIARPSPSGCRALRLSSNSTLPTSSTSTPSPSGSASTRPTRRCPPLDRVRTPGRVPTSSRAPGRTSRRRSDQRLQPQGARRQRIPLATDGGSVVGLTFDARSSRGRSMTGWASPRPRSNRPTAIWPATSVPRASGAISSPRGRSARPPRSRSRVRAVQSASGRARALGWNVSDPVPTARACVALLSGVVPGDDRRIVHVDGGVTRWASSFPMTGVTAEEVRLLEGPNLYFAKPAPQVRST